ncbi:MAG: hypothetical protein V8R01_00750 [Bacilli bacterium]
MHKTLNIITIVLLSFLVLVLTGILVLGITRETISLEVKNWNLLKMKHSN